MGSRPTREQGIDWYVPGVGELESEALGCVVPALETPVPIAWNIGQEGAIGPAQTLDDDACCPDRKSP